MYTLLIADDEYYSLNGLKKNIPFEELGITTVLEAANGKEGVELAKIHTIDIIISDIKMPQMNGIQMVEKIRQIYPDCITIFLSGYSDKEYLRSAISLKAINYIDKPVDKAVLRETMYHAIEECRQIQSSKLFQQRIKESKLIRNILTPNISNDELYKSLKQSGHTHEEFADSRTLVVQFLENKAGSIPLDSYQSILQDILMKLHLPHLITTYRNQYIIIHLLSSNARMVSSITRTYLENMLQMISKAFQYTPHFISVGSLAASIDYLYHSYQTAVISLQTNFYLGENSHSFSDDSLSDGALNIKLITEEFEKTIIHNKKEECFHHLAQMMAFLESHQSILVSKVKEMYYLMINWLIQYSASMNLESNEFSNINVSEYVFSANTLNKLHQMLCNKSNNYFELKSNPTKKVKISDVINQIIKEQYHDPNLNIQYISEQLDYSVSYISNMYKQETDNTINAFIIEYRIQTAKEKLIYSDEKIADIALQCGFSDHNYFTKSFKKSTRYLPSQFREIKRKC